MKQLIDYTEILVVHCTLKSRGGQSHTFEKEIHCFFFYDALNTRKRVPTIQLNFICFIASELYLMNKVLESKNELATN